MKNKKLVWIVCLIVFVSLLVCISYLVFASPTKAKQQSWAKTVTIESKTEYKVLEVLDGDTFKVSIQSHDITVRMLGIDTPETVDPRKGVQCYGPEASTETKSLLIGKNVKLALNPSYERTDKYGRLLAYVYVGDIFLNEFLVKQGYAREYTFNEKNPYLYQKEFKFDQDLAQKEKRGLWGKCEN